jgi:hypothetical protein
MNDNRHEDGGQLSQALKTWKLTTPLPLHFQEQVWRRIARAEKVAPVTLWYVFQNWLEAALSRRAVVVSYLAVLLAGGLMTGYLSSVAKARTIETRLSAQYLRSVDPYRMTGENK